MSKSLDDKAFKRFKKIIDPYPEQILRYCKGGEPVWVSAESLPDKIPACETCGSPREFELQVSRAFQSCDSLDVSRLDLLSDCRK